LAQLVKKVVAVQEMAELQCLAVRKDLTEVLEMLQEEEELLQLE
jgi:hypothetical protein